ncbi:hypothetical protein [Streptomyces sp. TRM70350]|uniref:hypothetical protein n=1 Tax=Streptomyces sp. TRM70350 TaxID=2856165 RepID=UPI001C4932CB|nr:hypothetical protein [Streptomyces sp. TRM70350]MBV7699255.1 hypothetical protein [Streptomyces sp. TRM70350]
MAASAHLLLSALSDDTPRTQGTSAPGDTTRSKRTPFPRQAEPSPADGASADPDLARVCVFSAEGACTEAPLTSEPPLPDAEPLTSEPPLAVPDADSTRP